MPERNYSFELTFYISINYQIKAIWPFFASEINFESKNENIFPGSGTL